MLRANHNQLKVCIAGEEGAGKDSAGDHLRIDHGFLHVSYGNLLREIANARKVDRERASLGSISKALRRSYGPTAMAQLAIAEWYVAEEEHLVVSGPRAVGDAQGIRDIGGIIVFVYAPLELRHSRVVGRQRDAEARMSLDEFAAQDVRLQADSGTPDGPNLLGIRAMADVWIENADSEELFYARLDGAPGLSH